MKITLTQKGTGAEAATAKDISESDPKTVVSGKKEKEDDENLESKKRDKSTAECISWPFKPPSQNKDKENEDGEEKVGAPLY